MLHQTSKLASDRVAKPLRPAFSEALNAADAGNPVGDCVVARVLIRSTRVTVGEPASLLEVEAINRIGDGGTLMSKKNASLAAEVDTDEAPR